MPEWLVHISRDFWSVLSDMAPFLLFGFFAAGSLSVLLSPRSVERHLGSGRFWPVLKAAAFGVPLPLCSCGVIPVSASLRRHGAGKGATTAFLISTPQTGVDSILATFSLLGWVYAIYRPVFALLTGVAGGLVVSATESDDKAQPTQHEDSCQESCCAESRHGRLYRIFSYGFGTLVQDIARPLIVGLLIAALISALVPKNYFADVIQPGLGQIVVLMLAGIPVYVCATASIPLAYVLILAGASPGAAFAFLMTGPATNAATIATIWKVLGRRTTILYLLTMAAGALAGGLLLDELITADQVQHAYGAHWMMPTIVKDISAVALLGLLGWAIGKPYLQRLLCPSRRQDPFVVLDITGMTCRHCADSVRRALQNCSGVTAVEVDLSGGQATLSGRDVRLPALQDAVEKLGYTVTQIHSEGAKP